MGGRSVKADGPAPFLPFYDIGLEPLSVCNIHYMHLLVFHKPGGISQFAVYCYAPYVVEVGLCYSYAVYFGFQYFYVHDSAVKLKCDIVD